jgi:ankyrin repeat protein
VKFLNSNSYDEDSSAILTLTLALCLPVDKAKSMAKLLLQLGAVSSQGDSRGTTAFHRYIESGKSELIDTLLEHDKTGVKTAINHIVFNGYYWSPEAVAPLSSAIEHGDPILILKLLNAGALPEINFETWIKAAKISPTQSKNLKDLKENKDQFKQMEQPITVAIQQGYPEIAIQLLEKGANPSTLTAESEGLLVNEYRRRWSKGRSILDLVDKFIQELKSYTGDSLGSRKPHEIPGMHQYLQDITPNTYRYFVVSDDIEMKKSSYEERLKVYEENKKKAASADGDALKLEAIKENIAGFEKLRGIMISKGAKTFNQIHPDIKTMDDNDSTTSSSSGNESTSKPYHYAFRFNQVKDLTDNRLEAYIEL